MNRIIQILSCAALSSLAANAITYDAAVDGVNAPAGSTFVATGGNLDLKSRDGFTGMGVDAWTLGEIDLAEKLTVSFDAAQVINQITIGFIFDGPEHGDLNEIAAFRINGTAEYTLTITGETTAIWTGSGSVGNLSPADALGTGAWQLSNPFGDIPITSIEFYPLSSNPGGNESDFSLGSFETRKAVPDAGSTAGLLILSIGAVLSLRRLRS